MTTDLLGRVHDRLRDPAAGATDPRVTVGDRALLVECRHPAHGRTAGLAHRPDGKPPDAWPASVAELAALSTGADDPLPRAVGIATLNALSAPDVDWRVGDPMAALSPDVDVVATVGLFRPALRKFHDVTVRVVERDPPATVDAPPGVTVTTYAPSDCAGAFADADVCFVTGSVLVYGGIDRYLAALADADVSPVVLVGATASHWPEPAFDAGVDLVAGARVTDPDGVREGVLAGDCGTDLHDDGVEKVYVTRGGEIPGLTLPAGSGTDGA
ncbi:Rossmann-like domain-containing protein [Haloarchaeobius sp. HRN-SO-5]|uniref:Rossmann-like domain-containing protein n=1 Tax=Haloarchaeobius sp. HRN-SO-5 TaxID=3446118 RepID=UPI003EBD036F